MGPESQSVPPPQPSQPSSSAAAPLPTSGVADGVEREEQPDLGHQHRADQAPETEPGDGAENPVTGPPDSFDYDTLVASGKPDPAAERAAWERLPPLAAALHHASAAATSGGTPRLGWFGRCGDLCCAGPLSLRARPRRTLGRVDTTRRCGGPAEKIAVDRAYRAASEPAETLGRRGRDTSSPPSRSRSRRTLRASVLAPLRSRSP